MKNNFKEINPNELTSINGGKGGLFDKWSKLEALKEMAKAGSSFTKGFNKGFKKGKPLSSMFD